MIIFGMGTDEEKPPLVTREQVCSQYSHCLSCPLILGSCDCHSMDQQDINDIMYIWRGLETKQRYNHKILCMTPEKMQYLLNRLRDGKSS